MQDFLLVALLFEHAIGKRWFCEVHLVNLAGQAAVDAHVAVRKITEARIAERLKGAMRVRAAGELAISTAGGSNRIPWLHTMLIVEKAMQTSVVSDAVPAFAANDRSPVEERFQRILQTKVDDVVAQGFRPVSWSLSIVS